MKESEGRQEEKRRMRAEVCHGENDTFLRRRFNKGKVLGVGGGGE